MRRSRLRSSFPPGDDFRFKFHGLGVRVSGFRVAGFLVCGSINEGRKFKVKGSR